MSTAQIASDVPVETVVVRNPATGEVLEEVRAHTPDEVRELTARARRAQGDWKQVPLAERARRVLALRDALVRRADELCHAITRENGKTHGEALAMELT